MQAALAHGLRSDVQFDPAGDGAVRLTFEQVKPEITPLYEAIRIRQCTRDEYDGRSLAPDQLRQLEMIGQGNGVHVLLLTGKPQIERVLAYVLQGNSAEINDPAFMTELMQWIRFSDAEAASKLDGLLSRAAGGPSLPRWSGNLMFRFVLSAKSDNEKYARFVRSSAGLAVFVTGSDDKPHWVEAGRAYERFALQATATGVRTAMLNQAVEVAAVRARLAEALGLGGRRPDLVLRFGYGAPMPRSLRRAPGAVIVPN
ncbi:MAG: hypothetical protein WCE44_08460 [Candidatus Velthaea sp.]